MTRNYGTPKVLHIQETDCDGNKRIVRYYREDTIDYFVSNVESLLKRLEKKQTERKSNMDLYAYANIDYLDELAKKNGIKCPRLRGYRLMKDEKPVDTNIKRFIKEHKIDYYSVEHLCTSVPFWCPTSNESIFSYDTDLKVDYYLDKKNEVVRWDRIHGWKRRV